ncbi:MAG: SDR family oxidoreductase [Thermodesulfobacteriota bacterium]
MYRVTGKSVPEVKCPVDRKSFGKLWKAIWQSRKALKINRSLETNRTLGILENVDPSRWKEHLFGLPPERWRRLSGKAFWITGSGTGYGRSIGSALAAAGAQVFLTGRRVEKLKETLDEMSSLFGINLERCHIIRADLTQLKDIKMACDEVKSLSNCLHGIVHCAALPSKPGSRYPLHDDLIEYWDQMIATNVRAPWLLTRTIFPHMIRSGEVRVVFMTSEAGWANTSGFGMYNVTKAALNSLGHSMAREYAARYPDMDIQMNVVSPSEARTEMNQGSSISPYSIVCIVLFLLSHPKGGPNGKFFHRDGRHLRFCYTEPYRRVLV